MSASFINDPKHWRERAEQMRTIAEETHNPLAKETMLRIAQDYEHLAQRAEARLAGDAPGQ